MDTAPNPAAAELDAAVRDMAARATVAVGLLGVGLIHVLDGIGKYTETRYLFWMFMGLVAGSVVIAGAVLFTRSRAALLAATGLMVSALIGYVLSRTTGLPNATGDIGNWKEPIGVANVFLEAATIALAVPAFLLGRAPGAAPVIAGGPAAMGRRAQATA